MSVFPIDSASRFKWIFIMLAIIIVFAIFAIPAFVFSMLGYFNWDSIPGGQCPPRCVLDSDVQFALIPKPNVTINYFCWNGIPQAEIIPAPDANSGAVFSTPDAWLANDVCRHSIRTVPDASMIFPYYISQLVYGKCGIVYRCTSKYYSP